MDNLKEWWAQAPARDQLALVICSGFLIVYFLFMVVLKPVNDLRQKQIVTNNALRNSLENVRELASQVVANKSSGQSNRRGNALENIVQQTVSANNLQVASMNASGKNGVRLRFEEARFENVLKWMYEMEVSQNVKIKDLSVSNSSNPGMVTVNLRMHQD
ncbi:type II secretion system protein GspM [Agarilytica rhodophyticola]|uniref:type II secretion system protein GspM n=1 Tax=Agarilytica rhodophyticola TaxID=1737490 RepID=UPI000B34928D|nr:type II secretion system protein M [Agarilytica rhodophyticola]